MSKDDLEAEKEALVQGYVEGILTPAESARLGELLRQDPLLARILMENLQMEGALREITGAETVSAPAPQPKLSDSQKMKSTRRFRTARSVAPQGSWNPLVLGAVAAVLLIGVLFVVTSGPTGTDPVVTAMREKRRAWEKQWRDNQERVRRAEERLAQVQQQRESLSRTTTGVPEAKKKQELQNLDAERAKVEEDLKDALRKSNEAKQEIERPEPAETIVKSPAEPAASTTVVAGATILPEGEVYVVTARERTLLQAARALTAGEGLETGAGGAQARIVFPDRSLVLLGSDTQIEQIQGGADKIIKIARGTIRAQVAKQTGGSMMFSSKYGDAKVLGTSLRIVVDPTGPGSMRLEVAEGKVQLQRLLDKKTVDVTTGHYAIVTAGAELASREMRIDDIVLYPSMGSVSGGEWQSVEDPMATSGYALEALQTSPKIKSSSALVNKMKADHVSFTFQADEYRDYAVRVKGSNLGAVAVSIPGATIKPAMAGTGAFPLPNFPASSGYVWVGGEGNAATLSVRFLGKGSRTLRLYAAEAPVRVDSISLTAIKSAAETMLEKNGQITIIFGPEARSLPNDTEYLLDSAKEFDQARGYGWVGTLPWTDMDATKPKTDLQASFLAGGGKTASHTWHLVIPSGRYLVSASCGGYTKVIQGPHMVKVQDKTIVNRAMTEVAGFYPSPEVPVEVKDGRLVMTIAGHQSNLMPPDKSDDTLINFLKIRRIK
jgi:ferric-dicitrate binding protein FerR (iron transport regulator)